MMMAMMMAIHSEAQTNKVYDKVEVMPEYTGGMEALLERRPCRRGFHRRKRRFHFGSAFAESCSSVVGTRGHTRGEQYAQMDTWQSEG